jgi:hypothetical protein
MPIEGRLTTHCSPTRGSEAVVETYESRRSGPGGGALAVEAARYQARPKDRKSTPRRDVASRRWTIGVTKRCVERTYRVAPLNRASRRSPNTQGPINSLQKWKAIPISALD